MRYPGYAPFTALSMVGRTGRMSCTLKPWGVWKKEEKGKSNIRAEEDSSEELDSMNLDPRLSKLIPKFHEFSRALAPHLS